MQPPTDGEPALRPPLPWHDDEPLAILIRRVRTWRGKPQSAVAETLSELSGTHVTRLAINRWETGRRIPRANWRQHLSKALGIPIDVLDRAAAVSTAHRCRDQAPTPTTPPPAPADPDAHPRIILLICCCHEPSHAPTPTAATPEAPNPTDAPEPATPSAPKHVTAPIPDLTVESPQHH